MSRLLHKINKYAEGDDLPPDSAHPTPVAAKEPKPAQQSATPAASDYDKAVGIKPAVQYKNTGSSSSSIIAMQTSLITLAKTVNAQLNVADVAKVNPNDATPNPDAVAASGRASFSDFVTKNYLRNSDTPGIEFDSNPNKVQMSDKSPSQPTRMSGIMDTMSRIGSTKNEFTADGAWGPKTNAALRNAYAFAFSMLRLAADFKTPIKSYSQANLASFKIPEKDTDLTVSQKNALAPDLTKNVLAITAMFNEIKTKILENPNNKEFIENTQPFMSYKKKIPMSPQEQNFKNTWSKQRLPENNIAFSIQQPGSEGVTLHAIINYADLTSLESYDNWYNSAAAKDLKQPGVTSTMIIDAIRKALQASGGAAPASGVV